jgi:hypothetical protein
MIWPGLHFPTACAFRCSQPPGAFIRSEPAGLVPCRIRSWGHPSEPCSSRAAVRCFQRRSPLGVCAPSGSCSARESATRFSGLDWHRARSSPGPFPLQGSPSYRAGPAIHRSSPPVVGPADASGLRASTSGSHTRKARHVSLETADPPGVCGLMTRHARSSLARILESPPKAPG